MEEMNPIAAAAMQHAEDKTSRGVITQLLDGDRRHTHSPQAIVGRLVIAASKVFLWLTGVGAIAQLWPEAPWMKAAAFLLDFCRGLLS